MLTAAENPVAPAGLAALEVSQVAGQSAVTSAFAASPMKLLTPVARGQSVWAFTSSFGGGLVAGDQTQLELRLGPSARCFLGTQASTKIYRNAGLRACGHTTTAALAENSLLVFAPDPVSPFTNSSYTQRQEFHLGTGAGLVLVDWFTSGRAARGERWACNQFHSRNDVFQAGERIFVDSLALNSADDSLASPHVTGRFNCFALLLLVGEPLQTAAASLLGEISTQPVARTAPLICSASPVRHGAMLRVAGENVESVGRTLHHQLQFAAALLGDDPWARKW
jgi:urease accessory protein